MDRGLNELLKWSIENSSNENKESDAAPPANRSLNPEVLNALFGGPSDAELMRAAMGVINNNEASLEDKLIAFDNFEQLIESLDNANNLANLGLWTPLLAALEHNEAEIRRMAAWCIGTAVQNNEPSQERLMAMGGVSRLVGIAVQESEKADVRRKAVYALSSACRNYQPAMDVCLADLVKSGREGLPEKVDARDMDAVDVVIHQLKKDATPAS